MIDDPALAEQEVLVRDALLHLYDPAHLQTHPLARRLNVAPSSPTALRGKQLFEALLGAIESLRPLPGTPTDSRAWRTYRLLELRYIECLSTESVLAQLAISSTQYKRDHARALEAVTSVLRDRWLSADASTPAPSQPGSRESLALAEVDRLATHASTSSVDLAETLARLVEPLRPVAASTGIDLTFQATARPAVVDGDRVAIRQVLLGLLSVALEHCQGGILTVMLEPSDQSVRVTMAATAAAAASDQTRRASLELEVARRLVASLSGQLEVESSAEAGAWVARLALPATCRLVVLVVDNDPDFVGLVARYLTTEGARVVGAHDVERAISLTQELRPDVILLDVLLPGEDGWDLMLAVKSRPEIQHIPIIVCSVLYEPWVAQALGAAVYLTKPISQAALLEALAQIRTGKPGPVPAC